MCTVNGDDGDMLMINKSSENLLHKTCRSCYNPAQVVLRKKDAYCRSCFLNSSNHKFRATLGKSKMMKAGDRVLILFTGDQSSVALLHMLYCGLNEEISKRLVFSVDILFIDDGLVLGDSFKERQNTVEEVKGFTQDFDFKILITTLSEVLSESPRTMNTLTVNPNHEDELKLIFENLKTITSKEDLLYQLKQKLFIKIAESGGYNKVFTSETGTDLAIKLMVDISLGRGDQLCDEVGFCDRRSSTIPLLRPLKDFIQKEIVFYNVFHQLEAVRTKDLGTMCSPDASICKKTETFVNGLQEEFPSTVYTIFRTGDKFKMEEIPTSSEHEPCALCNRLLKFSSNDNCDAVDALNFSRKVSENDKKPPCCDSGANDCICTKQKMCDFKTKFCYGCSLILRDMGESDILQNHLVKMAEKENNIEKLRESISEFLID